MFNILMHFACWFVFFKFYIVILKNKALVLQWGGVGIWRTVKKTVKLFAWTNTYMLCTRLCPHVFFVRPRAKIRDARVIKIENDSTTALAPSNSQQYHAVTFALKFALFFWGKVVIISIASTKVEFQTLSRLKIVIPSFDIFIARSFHGTRLTTHKSVCISEEAYCRRRYQLG